jgi:hypothetical protein
MTFSQMNILRNDFEKWKNKYDKLLNVYWDEKNIEGHFKKPIWYYAHRKLRDYKNKLHNIHKKMFYLLTYFDGNSGVTFTSDSISAEEIYEDFKRKYINKYKYKNRIKRAKLKEEINE